MKRFVTASILLLLSAACDLAIPELARYDAEASSTIDVVIHASAMPAEGIQAVELELLNVLLHRADDDVWIIVGPESLKIELGETQSEVLIEGVPLDRASYDLVSVELGRVRVATDGSWTVAELATDALELPIALGGADAVVMELGFDLAASLSGDAEHGWLFDPAVHLDVVE